MEDHKEYNLKEGVEDSHGVPDFVSSESVARINKTLNIKDFYEFNDTEAIIRKGQKFGTFAFSTLILGSVYTAKTIDFLIGVTNLSYAASIGLPRPRDVGPGKHFIVKDEVGGAGSTTITIRSEGEETIDGAASATITTNYGIKEFYTDGANWFTKNNSNAGNFISGTNLLVASKAPADTSYTSPWHAGGTSAAEADRQTLIPVATTIGTLSFRVLTNTLTTANTTIRLRKNGADVGTAITFAAGEAGTKSAVQNISFAAGDLLSVSMVTDAGGAGTVEYYQCSVSGSA